MLKSVLIASMYTGLGLATWGAYTVISQQDTSIETIKSAAKQANQKLKYSLRETNPPVYRHKSKNGVWVYTDKPLDPAIANSYDQELQLLRSLPQEAMPTNAFPTTPQTTSKKNLPATDEPRYKLSRLMQEAKNVVKMLEERNQAINNIGKDE